MLAHERMRLSRGDSKQVTSDRHKDHIHGSFGFAACGAEVMPGGVPQRFFQITNCRGLLAAPMPMFGDVLAWRAIQYFMDVGR
jgi:hypothetical protein